MSHTALIDPSTIADDRKPVLDQIQAAFGSVPNVFRAVAASPAALRSMWGSFGALGGGTLPARLTEQLAVAVADRNGCDYCLAAHTALGRKAGAGRDEMRARRAASRATRGPRQRCASPRPWWTNGAGSARPPCRPCAMPASATGRSWS